MPKKLLIPFDLSHYLTHTLLRSHHDTKQFTKEFQRLIFGRNYLLIAKDSFTAFRYRLKYGILLNLFIYSYYCL